MAGALASWVFHVLEEDGGRRAGVFEDTGALESDEPDAFEGSFSGFGFRRYCNLPIINIYKAFG